MRGGLYRDFAGTIQISKMTQCNLAARSAFDRIDAAFRKARTMKWRHPKHVLAKHVLAKHVLAKHVLASTLDPRSHPHEVNSDRNAHSID